MLAAPCLCGGWSCRRLLTLTRLPCSVNKPGYRYVKTSLGPSAVACRRNEYCTGLKKQATCDKCPPNFATDVRNPVGSHTSSAVCGAWRVHAVCSD